MKSFCKLLAVSAAVCFATVAAFAADVSPTGTWKWTSPGRNGGAGMEQTLKLELSKDGALTGTMVGGEFNGNKIPDVAIGDASFKDGTVAFSVTREFNGNKFTSKYSGKLDGDTIKGSTERPGRDGNVRKTDWNATRAK
jgi:hypothetical protein